VVGEPSVVAPRGRKPVRDRLIDLLTERGVLASGERRVLGLVPVATHPVADPASAERARAAIGQVLLGRQEPDELTAALVQVSGLVDACVPTPTAGGRGAGPSRSPPETRSARPSSGSKKR
jgi:hypothetical protein